MPVIQVHVRRQIITTEVAVIEVEVPEFIANNPHAAYVAGEAYWKSYKGIVTDFKPSEITPIVCKDLAYKIYTVDAEGQIVEAKFDFGQVKD